MVSFSDGSLSVTQSHRLQSLKALYKISHQQTTRLIIALPPLPPAVDPDSAETLRQLVHLNQPFMISPDTRQTEGAEERERDREKNKERESEKREIEENENIEINVHK